MSQDEKTYEGQCYCGAVKITVTGDPVGAGYCHCKACRSWSAGPVNAFTLWPPEAVTVTQGEDKIAEYNANPRSYRQWCTVCGGHLMTRHPEWNLVDVFAATIPTFPFEPGVHVNYESTVLPMKDGLPEAEGLPGGARRLRRVDGRVTRSRTVRNGGRTPGMLRGPDSGRRWPAGRRRGGAARRGRRSPSCLLRRATSTGPPSP